MSKEFREFSVRGQFNAYGSSITACEACVRNPVGQRHSIVLTKAAKLNRTLISRQISHETATRSGQLTTIPTIRWKRGTSVAMKLVTDSDQPNRIHKKGRLVGTVTCRSHRLRAPVARINCPDDPTLVNYLGGALGSWKVKAAETHAGVPLKPVSHLEITTGRQIRAPLGTSWILQAAVCTTRFINREVPRHFGEFRSLTTPPEMPCGALILVRKSQDWWNLAHDERRELLQRRANLITPKLRFLPALVRRLRNQPNLDENFDFLTWFEYDARDSNIVDDLVGAIRTSDEWRYVDREIDFRVER